MKMPDKIEQVMFAPCGLNCMVCYKHLLPKQACPGCLLDAPGKPERCRECAKKECADAKGVDYCFQCDQFPCRMVRNLERSYTKRYGISLFQNCRTVNDLGLEQFMVGEKARWSCSQCGGIISLHDGECSECHGQLRK